MNKEYIFQQFLFLILLVFTSSVISLKPCGHEHFLSFVTHFNIKPVLHYIGENNNTNFEKSPNASSWDPNWIESMGGIDYPDSQNRSGFFPIKFMPRQNVFYCALPYNDLDQWGRKISSIHIPWADEIDLNDHRDSIIQHRWIRVATHEVEGYCQLEDVGPGGSDDFDYVFGPAHAIPEYEHGGIGISPALAQVLGMLNHIKSRDMVMWSFVDEHHVPNGPWIFKKEKKEKLLRTKRKY
ncbi:hypothetical protein PPL_06932 [Heterostelium album PN500]|uniref:Uncharacterized protein n=1 Tax=Heterostelium pallidum (strain ATCC 26659 / Pp 5 / PN500) TaxID=670386 RepID=D3BDX9_HETP5|nr:hypothetical protein PPL_06932 [Heterostelium album PN500]EFA80110.1 hypothetical protein PPL_06932 [Heterostelium album PN500]|eukprot:XP_020432230.1 hypothetical protein PPL_06932 [Heterostelium album PN500]